MDRKTVAYWNIYDTNSKQVLEECRAIVDKAMPMAGDLLVGIQGKSQAIVKNVRFAGKKDDLPCYDVYV